ncbi:hypothetical protein Trydic_g16848 [Trypoxylus dichotomus]
MNAHIAGTLENKVRKDTLLRFYKTMVGPCGIYGIEIWAVTKANEKTIQTSEMRFLRTAAAYTRMDRKRNTDIREENGIRSVKKIMRKYRRNWRGHTERLEDYRIPKRV